MGLNSLEETIRFIEEQWSQDVADEFLDRLDERVDLLKKNSRIGPTYNQSEFRQLIIHPLVTLYYLIEGDFINLVLVWANKQNPDELKSRLKRM